MADISNANPIAKVKVPPSGSSGKLVDAIATPADDAAYMQPQKQATAAAPLVSNTVEKKTIEVVPITLTGSTGPSFASTSVSLVNAAATDPAVGQSAGRPDSRRKPPTPGGTPARSRPITHASTPSLSRRDGGGSGGNGHHFYGAPTNIFSAGHKRQHSSASLHHQHHHHGGGTFSTMAGGASHNGNNNGSSPLPMIDAFAPLLYRTGSRVWEDIQEMKGTGHVKRTSSSTKMYILGADEESSNSSSEEENDEEGRVTTAETKKNTNRPSSISRRRSRTTPGSASRSESWQREPLEEYNPLNYQTTAIVDDDENVSVYSSAGGLGASDADEEESYMIEEYFDAANSPSGSAITTTIDTTTPTITIPAAAHASSTFAPTRNRLISVIDWILGVDSDDSLFAFYAEAQQQQRAQEQARSLAAIPSIYGNDISPRTQEKRDEEQGLNLDVVLVLGTLSLLADGIS
jgi:hypothetical protein